MLLPALLCATQAQARPFRVCAFSFNSPDELAAVRSHLPAGEFEIVDLSPPRLSGWDGTDAGQRYPAGSESPAGDGPPPWLLNQCRPDLQCDIAVYSGEFGGRFFGRYGRSIGLQELEEASCQAQCRGLFHHPHEVFLLACNTLATKDQDSRTPQEYLQVLLDHGFDHASAERVVDLRYGPLGPSFRESLRRIFMGVPQLYGFSSVAPRGEWTASRLGQYFRAKGDYGRYLRKAPRDGGRNAQLLAAFKGSSFVQSSGVTPSEPEAVDRALVCRLYDENQIRPRTCGRACSGSFKPKRESPPTHDTRCATEHCPLKARMRCRASSSRGDDRRAALAAWAPMR